MGHLQKPGVGRGKKGKGDAGYVKKVALTQHHSQQKTKKKKKETPLKIKDTKRENRHARHGGLLPSIKKHSQVGSGSYRQREPNSAAGGNRATVGGQDAGDYGKEVLSDCVRFAVHY